MTNIGGSRTGEQSGPGGTHHALSPESALQFRSAFRHHTSCFIWENEAAALPVPTHGLPWGDEQPQAAVCSLGSLPGSTLLPGGWGKRCSAHSQAGGASPPGPPSRPWRRLAATSKPPEASRAMLPHASHPLYQFKPNYGKKYFSKYFLFSFFIFNFFPQ